jgi:hypothetical protein
MPLVPCGSQIDKKASCLGCAASLGGTALPTAGRKMDERGSEESRFSETLRFFLQILPLDLARPQVIDSKAWQI